jgi:very-short-patch-repair endonuclease
VGDFPRKAGKISTLAARQYGHVTRKQLLAIGLTSRKIDYDIETGRLIRVHAGVYGLEYRRTEPIALAAAAVLACGPGAALSHDSAAALWGFRRYWPTRAEVSIPGDRRRPGIKIYRHRRLPLRTEKGIRTTSPAQTILDIEPRLTDRQLTRAINDARLGKCLRIADLQELAEHERNKRVIELIDPSQNATRSGLEDEFLVFARKWGLPTPKVNTVIAGFEVDALVEQERVIVEIDDYGTHGDPATFESDRERDATTLALDLVTIRITRGRMRKEPGNEAARVQEILAKRR